MSDNVTDLDAPAAEADPYEGLPVWCRPGEEIVYYTSAGWGDQDSYVYEGTVARIGKRDVVFDVPGVRNEVRFTRRDYTPAGRKCGHRDDDDTFNRMGARGRVLPPDHVTLDLLRARAGYTWRRGQLSVALRAYEKADRRETTTRDYAELLDAVSVASAHARNTALSLANAEDRATRRRLEASE